MPYASAFGNQMTMSMGSDNRGKRPALQHSAADMHSMAMMESMFGTSSTTYFKKDLLWKPLVRRFRRYLKKEALPSETYQRIFSKPVIKWGSHFCKAFDVPEPLRSDPRT